MYSLLVLVLTIKAVSQRQYQQLARCSMEGIRKVRLSLLPEKHLDANIVTLIE